MLVRMFLYAIAAVISTFTVSGMNINGIFKQGAIWEARIFIIILIICITHILEEFAYTLINLY